MLGLEAVALEFRLFFSAALDLRDFAMAAAGDSVGEAGFGAGVSGLAGVVVDVVVVEGMSVSSAGLKASMRNSIISKPPRGEGARARSRRPMRAI